MKVLFLNPKPPRCGVHQYGHRFVALLQLIPELEVQYCEVDNGRGWALNADWFDQAFDVVIYNVHPGIDNFMLDGPVLDLGLRHVAIYHDGARHHGFDAWLFSGPPTETTEPLFFIGRPLPIWTPKPRQADHRPDGKLVVGLSGLVGAWANEMIHAVTASVTYNQVRFRVALPPSDHCDPGAGIATAAADRARAAHPDVEITHEFMTQSDLLGWLSQNDVNCYIRPPLPSAGISSALDLALAVRRPIIINRHPMFRHVSESRPSICLDDRPFMEIYRDGLNPLIQHYSRHDPELVSREIHHVLEQVAA